ncbi:MAG: GIY-YIG nuclease family protein, partial [Oscillospiraceae bacterium]|nr:GIY-YIG nuclease family protein [Oscillospiraceae bacterium]
MQRQGSDMEEKTCYVYLLRCEGGSLYAGITSDPERRLR